MILKKMQISIAILVVFSLVSSCGNLDNSSVTDNEEVGQQVGEVMASLDEGGGSSLGSIAFNGFLEQKFLYKTMARLSPQDVRLPLSLEPKAYAVTCLAANTFGTCSNNVMTRSFAGCTIGAATLIGSVALTWTDGTVDGTCLMTTAGHSISRSPNFTLTGRKNASLAVTNVGAIGQTITRGASADSFTFTNDGIRRVFTNSLGVKTYDFTTKTTSAITITGSSRAGRTLSGGVLQVANNLTSVSCDFTPSAVTWSSTCNCAVSGSWSGTCSDSKAAALTLTGCGTGTLVVGSVSQSVTFDRCYGS